MNGAVIEDIKSILTKKPDWTIGFIFRRGNSVAKELAKMALRMEGKCCWSKEGPIEIYSIINREMLCNDL